jgi:hypothetical protein
MHRISKTKKLVLGVVALAAISAAAFAYWTGSGSGTGSGDVGTSNSVTLTGVVTDGVSPATSTPVSFTAANPSDSAIRVTYVHLVGIAVDSGHAGCVTADFSMGDVQQDHQVPPGATVEPLPNDGSLDFAETALNQDACKGATLTLTLSSS